MTSALRTISPSSLNDNVFKLISEDWMLITAGDLTSFNTMTASWGTMGELWNKKICVCFVRPTRHTYHFIEKADAFTLCSFAEEHRSILKYCGKVSGRDVDKTRIPGLTPKKSTSGSVYFDEARLVFDCTKIYTADLDPARFLKSEIHDCYPKKDYHRMYIGEIVTCLHRSDG